MLDYVLASPQGQHYASLSEFLPARLQPVENARLALVRCKSLPVAQQRGFAAGAAANKLIALRKELMPDPANDPYAAALARWSVYFSNVERAWLRLRTRRKLTDDAIEVLEPWEDRAPLAVALLWIVRCEMDRMQPGLVLGLMKRSLALYDRKPFEPNPGTHTRWHTLNAKADIGWALCALERYEEALEYLPDAVEKLLAIEGEAIDWNATRHRRDLVDAYIQLGRFDEARPHLVRNAHATTSILEASTRAYVEHEWPEVAAALETLKEALASNEGIGQAWAQLGAARDRSLGDDTDNLVLLSELLVMPLKGASESAPPADIVPCLQEFDALRRRLYPPRHAFHGFAAELSRAHARMARAHLAAKEFDAARAALQEADRVHVDRYGQTWTRDYCSDVLQAMVDAGKPEWATAWALPILALPPHATIGLTGAVTEVEGLEPALYKAVLKVYFDQHGPKAWPYQTAWFAALLSYRLGEWQHGLDYLDAHPEEAWAGYYGLHRAALQAVFYEKLGRHDDAKRLLEKADKLLHLAGYSAFWPTPGQIVKATFPDR
jgi:tetratricopeptide (TPR) repeat protein